MAWTKEQADIETLRYKENEERKTVLIPFHSDKRLDYGMNRLTETFREECEEILGL